MANTGFKGVDVLQTGTAILFRAFLLNASGSFVTSGTTNLLLYELQSDGSLKSYDWSSNTFKTTTLTTETQAMTVQAGNNGATATGLWTYALTMLTGFTVGAMYLYRVNSSGAAPTDQWREFQYGGDQGDLAVTQGSTGVGYAQADIQEWVGIAPLALSSQLVQATASISGTVNANVTEIAGQTASAAGAVTFPSSIASPTNITAGTITTTTNLTNAPTAGDFTATMKTSIGTAVAASDVAGITGVTFPTHFSSLAIDASGRIDVGSILGTASQGAAGYVGLDWSKIDNPTATVGLTGTTIGSVQSAVLANVTEINSVSCASVIVVGDYVGTSSQIGFDGSGNVKANAETVTDKVGYSLTQAFPSNFATLAIDGLGDVTYNNPAPPNAFQVATEVWLVSGRTLSSFAFPVTVGGYSAGEDPATLVLAGLIDTTYSLAQYIRAIGATTAGADSGAPGTPAFRSLDNLTVYVNSTADASGNRVVTYAI